MMFLGADQVIIVFLDLTLLGVSGSNPVCQIKIL